MRNIAGISKGYSHQKGTRTRNRRESFSGIHGKRMVSHLAADNVSPTLSSPRQCAEFTTELHFAPQDPCQRWQRLSSANPLKKENMEKPMAEKKMPKHEPET